jgi:hypothetical protein
MEFFFFPPSAYSFTWIEGGSVSSVLSVDWVSSKGAL